MKKIILFLSTLVLIVLTGCSAVAPPSNQYVRFPKDQNPKMATITIMRESDGTNNIIGFEVFSNDIHVADLNAKSYVKFEVEPGKVKLQAKQKSMTTVYVTGTEEFIAEAGKNYYFQGSIFKFAIAGKISLTPIHQKKFEANKSILKSPMLGADVN
ncbi:MAG: hypothetical protein ACRC5T_10390 [Cetobacterium sp.]